MSPGSGLVIFLTVTKYLIKADDTETGFSGLMVGPGGVRSHCFHGLRSRFERILALTQLPLSIVVWDLCLRTAPPTFRVGHPATINLI